jgi:hypothetical protein
VTLPDERYRSIKMTECFLVSLCNPKLTPKVPKEIRERARSCLKHYPSSYDMDMVSEALPDRFQKDKNV